MGVESFLWLRGKLQDEFHVSEMIPEAGIYGFARIGKVLSFARVGRPLALAKVLVCCQALYQPPHNASLVNKFVNSQWKSGKLIHRLFTSGSLSSLEWLTFLCPVRGHPGWSDGAAGDHVGRVMVGRAARDRIADHRNTEEFPRSPSEPRISVPLPAPPEQGSVPPLVQAPTWMVPDSTIQFECYAKTLS